MSTVGLVVGTGRGGIIRTCAEVAAAAGTTTDGAEAAEALGAKRSASGSLLSHVVEKTRAMSNEPRSMNRCERVDAPGRVRCEVEARVKSGDAITFGDVVIVRTPSFLSALRGRIGPHDATTREAELWRWALALAARAKGSGDLDARVRLVVCHGATCEPRETPVVARVVVGD
jgi:hypothetical protein